MLGAQPGEGDQLMSEDRSIQSTTCKIEFSPAQRVELQILDETLFTQLHHYFTQVQKMRSVDMMYDAGGKSAFVIIGFNHPTDPKVLGDDATANDKAVAIGSVAIACMPEVQAHPETQTIGPHETICHGVQAVAASMLLSSMQKGAVYECMGMAQKVIMKNRRMM